jgi:hypothetical protein
MKRLQYLLIFLLMVGMVFCASACVVSETTEDDTISEETGESAEDTEEPDPSEEFINNQEVSWEDLTLTEIPEPLQGLINGINSVEIEGSDEPLVVQIEISEIKIETTEDWADAIKELYGSQSDVFGNAFQETIIGYGVTTAEEILVDDYSNDYIGSYYFLDSDNAVKIELAYGDGIAILTMVQGE